MSRIPAPMRETAIPDAVDLLVRRPELVDAAAIASALDCVARWSA